MWEREEKEGNAQAFIRERGSREFIIMTDHQVWLNQGLWKKALKALK